MPPDKGETFVQGHQIGCKILHEVTLSSGIGGKRCYRDTLLSSDCQYSMDGRVAPWVSRHLRAPARGAPTPRGLGQGSQNYPLPELPS